MGCCVRHHHDGGEELHVRSLEGGDRTHVGDVACRGSMQQ